MVPKTWQMPNANDHGVVWVGINPESGLIESSVVPNIFSCWEAQAGFMHPGLNIA